MWQPRRPPPPFVLSLSKDPVIARRTSDVATPPPTAPVHPEPVEGHPLSLDGRGLG